MPPRLVEQWRTMYEVVPTLTGTTYSYPATVRPVQVTMERRRDPSQRRWRGRWLHPDGSLFMEDWISAYNFRRMFFNTEVEAWEGLLAWEREALAHFKERLAQAEREVAELEQQVRFKRWQAEHAT